MRILLVEDDPGVGTAILHCLKIWQYEVETVDNGEEAWQKLQQHTPDILITDWALPGMTGTDLVKRIRLEGRVPDMPVLMISGRAEKKDVTEAIKSGINTYLPKPFTPSQLKEKITHACHPLNRLPTQRAIARVIDGASRIGGWDEPLIVLGESTTRLDELVKPEKRALARYLIWIKGAVDQANRVRPDLKLAYTLEANTQSIAERLASTTFRHRTRLLLVSTDCPGDAYSLMRSVKRSPSNRSAPIIINKDNDFPKQIRTDFPKMGIQLLARRSLVPEVIDRLIDRYVVQDAS